MNRLLCCMCLLMFCRLGMAQAYVSESDAGGMSVTGEANIPLQPSRLRLVMQVQAQGLDAKSALGSLTTHKTRVEKELQSMKADAESIKFSATQVVQGSGDPNEARQMQQMRRMSARNGQSIPEMPEMYIAKCSLMAEWPLPSQAGDVLALLPSTLREQVAKRDFAGEKNVPNLDPEAEEQLAEVEAMFNEQYAFFSEDHVEQGTMIYFVADVSEEQYKQGISAAFAQAKQKAETFAAATGLALDRVTSVKVVSSEMTQYGNPFRYQNANPVMTFSQSNDHTVLAATMDGLGQHVMLQLTFAIK